MSRLFRAADMFEVPATYMLYFGGIEFRGGLICDAPEHSDACGWCRRASVSVISGLQAQLAAPRGGTKLDAARLAFDMSMPLEDLADPALQPSPIRDRHLSTVSPDLREFLLQGQTGARQIARTMFGAVSTARSGQFAQVVRDRVTVSAAAIFPELPTDRGHFSGPYFPHILRGLRAGVPDYVQDILAGQRPPASVTDHVRGVVVARC